VEEGAQHEEKTMANTDETRREVLTKAVYMTPAIVTLPVLLSFASAGSGNPGGDAAGSGNPGGDAAGSGIPGDDAAGSGNPGDDGDDGRHKRWGRRKHHGWERGKHYGWENRHGQ
jgi:hypothetical protein